MNGFTKSAVIRTASITALLGNAALAVAKMAVGFVSGSLAVVGDGIDSSVDVIISVMTLFVSKVISKPADKNHPWGHGRAETIATALLACLLFFAGAELIRSSILFLIEKKVPEVPEMPAVIVTAVSIAGKLLLALSQYFFGKKARSPMLLANAKNMASDVLLSGGVLIGLGLSIYLHIGIIDSIAALAVGLWVIKSAVEIFVVTNTELMDGSGDAASYRAVFDAVRSVQGAGNPHRVRMRRVAGLWVVDIDIEVDPATTVRDAHNIADAVEKAIKQNVEDVYDIMVHIEPQGDTGPAEKYGLRENEL
ncbi:MAG: cation diffusion facilitator family transporter [Spirochaetaceae bacterium]|jgi:cation diffusion facilitator family transporter|nr:cation diffusion facilitator family transporter [Spirochaetaceae bacterium]